MKPILNVYGLYQSGKSLLYDAFVASPRFKTYDREDDFDLFRYPNGLFDLFLSVISHDPLIAGVKFSQFSNLLSSSLTTPKSKLDAYLFFRRDFNSFSRSFQPLTLHYLSELRHHTRSTFHPFSFSSLTFPHLPFYRFCNKYLGTSLPKSLLLTISENDFIEYTNSYLDSLFLDMLCSSNVYSESNAYSALILNNVCFPGQERLLHKLSPKISNILIIRDPIATFEDIIARSSAIWYKNQSNAFFIVNSFKSYLNHYESSLHSVITSDNSLILRFEDFVRSPSLQIFRISEYTGISISHLSELSINPLSSIELNKTHPLYAQYLTYARTEPYNTICSFYPQYET